MAGFATRDESDLDMKRFMLECLAGLMEDAHEKAWAYAKGGHAVLLARWRKAKFNGMILIKLIEFGVLMLKDMLKTALKSHRKKGNQKLCSVMFLST